MISEAIQRIKIISMSLAHKVQLFSDLKMIQEGCGWRAVAFHSMKIWTSGLWPGCCGQKDDEPAKRLNIDSVNEEAQLQHCS